jgi:hypothetical protein
MNKYFISIGFMLLILDNYLYCQALPPIQLDRPDQTECPFITPKHYIQIENGFTLERISANESYLTYPSILWKYGINDKTEIRLITEFATQLITENNTKKISAGIQPITIGFKTSLLQEKGLIPKTSFIGHVSSANLASNAFKIKNIAPSFRFTMQHTISNNLSIGYNLGAEWNGETADQNYIYTLTTGISITEKLGFYIELYGFLNKYNNPDHRFDSGLTYLLTNNFIIDFSGGLGLTANAPKNYLSFGISYRFKTK